MRVGEDWYREAPEPGVKPTYTRKQKTRDSCLVITHEGNYSDATLGDIADLRLWPLTRHTCETLEFLTERGPLVVFTKWTRFFGCRRSADRTEVSPGIYYEPV